MILILISWALFFLVGCQVLSPSKESFVVAEIPLPSANLRVEPIEAWVNTDTIMIIIDVSFGKMIGDLEECDPTISIGHLSRPYWILFNTYFQ